MMSYFATTVLASSMLLTTSVSGSCTGEHNNPPQNETVSIAVSTEKPDSSSLFEPPIRLSVDGDDKILNARTKKMFLSPAIFDVDGDDKDELVVGTLMGDVGVHENQNTSGEGDPVWSQWKALKNSNGQSIRTSNW